MEKIVNIAKNRGLIYNGSDIYGGLANSFDYGPIGVLLKQNIKNAWWKKFVTESPYNVGIDSAILMNKKVWEASGHTSNFSDPLIDCKECKSRFRADDLIENFYKENDIESEGEVDGLSKEELTNIIAEKKIPCPKCGQHNWTDIRAFNLMFKTYMGVTEDTVNEVFLRPETAQGIFVNFKNVLRTTRSKLPLGIAQIGKSFRNEITPGNFIFRTKEFEQMELEFFCHPDEDMKWFEYYKKFALDFLLALGIDQSLLKYEDHPKEKLSHYSKATTDIMFKFPFGWGELWGVANRTDFDLKSHSEVSGEDLTYFDAEENKRFIPYCIEPSLGVDRLLLSILIASFEEEKLDGDDSRNVFHFHPCLAPFKACVLPLSKKLNEGALKIYSELSKHFETDYDETSSIGKRYRRQDEIGTPFCITYDFDSETDNMVTIRDRDTMEQSRVPISDVVSYIEEKIKF